MSNDSGKSFFKDIIVPVVAAVVAAIATVLATKACDRISPDENRVTINDTVRVVEAHTPQNKNDSMLYLAITELNRTIRETIPRNNNISIVLPESGSPLGHAKQNTHIESVVPNTTVTDNSSSKAKDPVIIQEYHNYINKIVDKKGFYKNNSTLIL